MTDDTTTARLDTTDPDRPRGDVGLGDARRDQIADFLRMHVWREDFERSTHAAHNYHAWCAICTGDVEQIAAALAPLVAGWLGEEQRRTRCGCGWCCQSTKPYLRGEAHGVCRGSKAPTSGGTIS